VGEREIVVRYRALRDGRFRLGNGSHARIHAWSPTAIDLEIDGHRIRSRVSRAGDRFVIQGPRGDLELWLRPRFQVPGAEETSGGLVAPMPGKVIDVRVSVGDTVRAGETLVVLEAMKMEHPMTAPEDGVVAQVHVAVGEQVDNGALLLVVEPATDDAAEGDA
jgi:propionyl-CoA carboxylase alpha chain